MNCKPGDIAYIIRSAAGNEGRPVEVIDGDVESLPGDLGLRGFGHLWRVRSKTALATSVGIPLRAGEEFAFPDAWLRPIRPQSDEATTEESVFQPALPAAERRRVPA